MSDAYPRPAIVESTNGPSEVRRRILIYLGSATFLTGFLWMASMGLITFGAALLVSMIQLGVLLSPKLNVAPGFRILLIATNAVVVGIEAIRGPELTFNYAPTDTPSWFLCIGLFVVNQMGYSAICVPKGTHPYAGNFQRYLTAFGCVYLALSALAAVRSGHKFIEDRVSEYQHWKAHELDPDPFGSPKPSTPPARIGNLKPTNPHK